MVRSTSSQNALSTENPDYEPATDGIALQAIPYFPPFVTIYDMQENTSALFYLPLKPHWAHCMGNSYRVSPHCSLGRHWETSSGSRPVL